MEEINVTIEEKKSIKDKIIDFAKENKSKLVKGAAIVGGTLAGAGLIGFLASRHDDCDYDDEYDECDFEEIVEYDSDVDDEDSDEEDSTEEE